MLTCAWLVVSTHLKNRKVIEYHHPNFMVESIHEHTNMLNKWQLIYIYIYNWNHQIVADRHLCILWHEAWSSLVFVFFLRRCFTIAPWCGTSGTQVVVRPFRHLGFRGAIGSWRWVGEVKLSDSGTHSVDQPLIEYINTIQLAQLTQTKGTKGTPSTRSTSH